MMPGGVVFHWIAKTSQITWITTLVFVKPVAKPMKSLISHLTEYVYGAPTSARVAAIALVDSF